MIEGKRVLATLFRQEAEVKALKIKILHHCVESH